MTLYRPHLQKAWSSGSIFDGYVYKAMQDFYHPLYLPSLKRPHVPGLGSSGPSTLLMLSRLQVYVCNVYVGHMCMYMYYVYVYVYVYV